MAARFPIFSSASVSSRPEIYRAELLDPDTGLTVECAYTLVDEIGAGSYGKVYTARSLPIDGQMLSTGELFAVKRIESMGKDIRLVDAQLAGERLALNVRSKYINSPLGIVQRECGWDIVFPEVFDCDLRTLRQVYVEHLEPELKQKVICDSVSPLLSVMCRALAGLKTNEAHIHQSDIKPDNWLISLGLRNGRKRIALSDFGVAYVLNEGNVLFQGAKRGTARYLPPEASEEIPLRHARSDIHSAALVLLFWCTGTDPKQGADGRIDLSAAKAAAPKYLVETLNLMLSTNPAARPSIEQLMLYDPMMASREDPTDVFCNIVRQGVESASSIMGVPLINNVFTPKFSASAGAVARAVLFPEDALVSIPEQALFPTIKNRTAIWGEYVGLVGVATAAAAAATSDEHQPPVNQSAEAQEEEGDDQNQEHKEHATMDVDEVDVGNWNGLALDKMEIDPSYVDFINDETNEAARVVLVVRQNNENKGDPAKIVSAEMVTTLANRIMAQIAAAGEEEMMKRLADPAKKFQVTVHVFSIALRRLGGHATGAGARDWLAKVLRDTPTLSYLNPVRGGGRTFQKISTAVARVLQELVQK